MEASKSWLQSITLPRNGTGSPSSAGLPRWQTPTPVAQSLIPPSIVDSVYVSRPKASAAQQNQPARLLTQDVTQRDIEIELQYLLDAQAESLVLGLEGNLDDRSSTGSTTPTAQSVRSSSRQSRPPAQRRRPGLKSARKGIHRAIIALGTLKDEELGDIDRTIKFDEQSLGKIEHWEERKRKLQDASEQIDAGDEMQRVQELKQESDKMQLEINKTEERLQELKLAQRSLLRQVAAVENTVQAKMASYTSSLRTLEKDIENFLKTQPTARSDRIDMQDNSKSVWQLPQQQRSLAVAKQFAEETRDTHLHQRHSVEQERQALREGANIWQDAVLEINGFEKSLRSAMTYLSARPIQNGKAPSHDHVDGLRSLLQELAGVISSVQDKHDMAADRGWKLLIAALGAELDALKRGEIMLQDVLKAQSQSTEQLTPWDDGQSARGSSDGETLLDELNQGIMQNQAQAPTSNLVDANDADDEEPGPELMFSR